MKSEQIDKDILRLRGHFLNKYGAEIDDWEARMHHEAWENFKLLENQLKVSNAEINRARNEIKGQIQSVHFNTPKEAFYYGIGKNLWYGLAAIILTIAGIYFFNQYSKIKEVQQYLESDTNAFKYKKLISNAELLKVENKNYLILKYAKGEYMTIGKHYQLDRAKNRILVPLGKIE